LPKTSGSKLLEHGKRIVFEDFETHDEVVGLKLQANFLAHNCSQYLYEKGMPQWFVVDNSSYYPVLIAVPLATETSFECASRVLTNLSNKPKGS
jgi:hypothetical protein